MIYVLSLPRKRESTYGPKKFSIMSETCLIIFKFISVFRDLTESQRIFLDYPGAIVLEPRYSIYPVWQRFCHRQAAPGLTDIAISVHYAGRLAVTVYIRLVHHRMKV